MEVRNCKQCGRLYNYIGGTYKNFCPDCINKLEEKFIEVKDFIETNKRATMPEISEECNVKIEQIERWIREERLFFAEDSPIGIDCEKCGVTIKAGRFCPSCKAKMANVLADLYSSKENNPVRTRQDNDRMQLLSREFIDKVNKNK